MHPTGNGNSKNPNSEAHCPPHHSMQNKSKSTNERANIFLNLNPQANTKENETLHNKNNKEIMFGPPNYLPQKRKNSLNIYEVCDGDTFESIALKFKISVNWLKRQNRNKIIDPNFILSKGIKLNVTKPSDHMIKPLNCSLVSGESHDNSEESAEDDELGENGEAYIVFSENSFDFIPDNFEITHRSVHVKLTSLNENVVIYTPKTQREGSKHEDISMQIPQEIIEQEEAVKLNEEPENQTKQQNKTENNIAKSSQDEVDRIDDDQKEQEIFEEESKPNQQSVEIITLEKSEAVFNQVEISENKPPQILPTITTASINDISENTQSNDIEEVNNKSKIDIKVSSQEQSTITSNGLQDIEQKIEKSETHIINSEPNNDKNCVFVVSYLSDPLDENSLHALYFRVRKEEGNIFSNHLQEAIKEAKNRYKNKPKQTKNKPAPLPKPSSLPRSGLSESATSPLGFLQSFFNSIKDSFAHLNDDFTNTNNSNNNNNNNNNNNKNNANIQSNDIKRSYRRSYSEKTMNNPFKFPIFDLKNNDNKNTNKEDILKPRRKSEDGDILQSQPKRKLISASVLCQVKIIEGPSALFERTEEIDEIRSKLPYRMRSFEWMLIYRLSRDGSSFTNFFNYTRNSGPIVFIMSTSTNERIGAFIPTGFKYSSKYYGSGESFVFRFVKPENQNNDTNSVGVAGNKNESKNDESTITNDDVNSNDNNENSTITNNDNHIDDNDDKNNEKGEKEDINIDLDDASKSKENGKKEDNQVSDNVNKNRENEQNDDRDGNKDDQATDDVIKANESYKNVDESFDNIENNTINSENQNTDLDNTKNENEEAKIDDATEIDQENKINDATEINQENKINDATEIDQEKRITSPQNENIKKANTKRKEEEKLSSDTNPESLIPHLEIFRWTPGTNTNFMMSETNTIIIGIGNNKESYNKNDIETINSSHGQMSGPAIWIGEDLQYASSSPCDTFSSPQLTKKNFFYVNDIEIWKLGFFSHK